MKLLVIDHNALDSAQRRLYARIVEEGGIEMKLVVPAAWHNGFSALRYVPDEKKLPFDVVPLKALFSTRTHRLIYRSLYSVSSSFKPDVIYMNAEPENFQTLQASRIAKNLRAKFIFSSWRNIDHRVVGYPYKAGFLHKLIEQRVLNTASHGIVFNTTAKKLYAQAGFTNTTCILPHIDTEMFKPHKNELPARGGFTIGYVGRLIAAKGVDLLLTSLQDLPEHCHLMIVGEGPMREKLMDLAISLGVTGRVKFIRAMPTAELPKLFSAMDVLVLPSITTKYWKEQYGRVLIEAMGCSTPVIGSNSGEIPSVIGDSGIVFKENDREALLLGLERLMHNAALREELARRGMARVQQHNSLQVIAKQYHRLFSSIANSLNLG